MKATRFANRAWAFVLAVLMTLTLIAPQALAANTVDPVKPAGDKIIVSQTDYTLVEGVTESDVFLNTKEGNAQIAGFMTTIAPGAKATFKASYNGYYTEGSTPASRKDKAANLAWSMERTTQQAANYVKATGGNVIMAMNGDYYNMQTLQPTGYLIMEGNVIQTGNGGTWEPYFAVLKDGSYAIRDAGVVGVHCGDSNVNICSGICPVRQMVNEGLWVTLGSDIAGGAQLPMYKVITMSIRTSKARRVTDRWHPDFLTVPEGYYLGTTSGHKYFGAGDGFAVGDKLHAVVIDDGDFPEAAHALNVQERFERAIYMTHRHNIVSVWSDGREVVRR